MTHTNHFEDYEFREQEINAFFFGERREKMTYIEGWITVG